MLLRILDPHSKQNPQTPPVPKLPLVSTLTSCPWLSATGCSGSLCLPSPRVEGQPSSWLSNSRVSWGVVCLTTGDMKHPEVGEPLEKTRPGNNAVFEQWRNAVFGMLGPQNMLRKGSHGPWSGQCNPASARGLDLHPPSRAPRESAGSSQHPSQTEEFAGPAEQKNTQAPPEPLKGSQSVEGSARTGWC